MAEKSAGWGLEPWGETPWGGSDAPFHPSYQTQPIPVLHSGPVLSQGIGPDPAATGYSDY